MNIFHYLGDFFMASWIWQFTSDWFHPVIAGICMFFLMRIILRRGRLRSIGVSFATQLGGVSLLSFIAIGVLFHFFKWEFDPVDPYKGIEQITFFFPSIGLGVTYAILQSCIFLFIGLFKEINLIGYVVICWLSNSFAAMLSYMFVYMGELLKYQGG